MDLQDLKAQAVRINDLYDQLRAPGNRDVPGVS
jgi:hypothetical protein